jgi:ABC-type branched-subunit amino acid transport system ATPase component
VTAQVPALSIVGLEVMLAGARVLRGLSLDVPKGQTIGLVGHNGAGKTTTLRAVMGLLRSRGRVLMDGEEVGAWEPAKRARHGTGYVPEDRRLISSLSVAENLRLPAEACGASGAEVDRRLSAACALLPELDALLQRPAGVLSGGQQKMVALGRALMIGRRLLLLDEPFQGLAPVLARRYAEALASLRQHRPDTAILITESNPGLLTSLVERTYTIERGEIIPHQA